jgi:hypothetical protein
VAAACRCPVPLQREGGDSVSGAADADVLLRAIERCGHENPACRYPVAIPGGSCAAIAESRCSAIRRHRVLC